MIESDGNTIKIKRTTVASVVGSQFSRPVIYSRRVVVISPAVLNLVIVFRLRLTAINKDHFIPHRKTAILTCMLRGYKLTLF